MKQEIKDLYGLWLKKTEGNAELHDELSAIEGKEDEISDRFYRALEFGTGGLRGVLGAGTNRMNVFTVNQATQGLAGSVDDEPVALYSFRFRGIGFHSL